jgi:hypothetical protein
VFKGIRVFFDEMPWTGSAMTLPPFWLPRI